MTLKTKIKTKFTNQKNCHIDDINQMTNLTT